MKKIILLFTLVFLVLYGLSTYRNSKKEKPLVVIIMGAPGSGKGTHSSEISKTLHIPHISTGDLFRENIKKETELGKIAKELMENGNLIPDNIVVEMLFNHIKDKGYDLTGYILDGFPRTLIQAKALEQRLGKDYNKIALNLNIDEDKLVERITGRLICKSCQTPYHKLNLPPQIENQCDKCSGELYQRDDDNETVLKNRLDAYNTDTKPLLDFYENEKILQNIDSNGSKEVVLENLLQNIEQKKL